jgi:hypothetical protein
MSTRDPLRTPAAVPKNNYGKVLKTALRERLKP